MADLAKEDIKSIVTEAVAVTMDARELANKAEQAKDSEKAKEDFQSQSMVKPMPHLTNRFHY